MADEEDELTQRERRAQRHQENRRREMPGNVARSFKAYAPLALILGVVAVAAVGVWYVNSTGQDCPDPHWHATFGLFIPGADGAPERVDFASERTTTGLHYYDWDAHNAGTGDPYLSPTLHMHQAGTSQETGSADLGPAQWHMENPGKCIGVKSGLHVIEVDASDSSLNLWGEHKQVSGQFGTFEANETSQLRWFLQTAQGTWSETTWSDLKNHQMQDGESFMGALGHYTDAQIQSMESQIPAPISRPPPSTTATSAPPTTAPQSSATSAPAATNSTAPA
ncbi:MAG: hypothetical protein ABR562_02250 [Thermoplasmatota archaeon]